MRPKGIVSVNEEQLAQIVGTFPCGRRNLSIGVQLS